MPEVPGAVFNRGIVKAGEFSLDYAEAGPAEPTATIVSLPPSAGLEMSLAKDRLAEEYRVIEINPPGFGGKTDLTRPITNSELGEILAAAVLALVDGPFVLLGSGMGGTIALYLTARERKRVLGLVLDSSFTPTRPEDRRPVPVDPGQEYVPPAHPNKPWADPEYVAKQMADRVAIFRLVQPDFEAATTVPVVRESAVPVLSLLGEEDEFLNAGQAQSVRDALPQADVRLIPHGTHDLQGTVPDAFVTLVQSFVAGLSTHQEPANSTRDHQKRAPVHDR